MKKILRLQITELNKGDFFQFIKSVAHLSSTSPLFSIVRKNLELDLVALEQAFAKEKLTKETNEIQRLDTRRGNAFLFVFHQVKSFLYNENEPNCMKAAEKVRVVLKELGGRKIIYFDHNKQTAVIYNLVNVLHERLSAELAMLGLTNHIDYLNQCNDAFEVYYAVRNTLAAEHNGIVAFHRLYRGVAKHYSRFVLDVESIYRNTPSAAAELEQFIERLNVEVEKYKLLLD